MRPSRLAITYAALILSGPLSSTAAAQTSRDPRLVLAEPMASNQAGRQLDDTERPLDPSATEQRWYGWQTIISDVAALAIMATFAAGESDGPVMLGLGVFLLGAPLIHAAHGNGWWVGSVAMRAAAVGLIFGGALVAFSSCPLFGGYCDGGGRELGTGMAVTGLALGLVTPILDAVLADERVPRADARGLALSPWVAPRAHAGGLALSGRL